MAVAQFADVRSEPADPFHGDDQASPGTLFLVFTADPCVAVIPLIFAAVPLGWPTTLAVIAAYDVATIGNDGGAGAADPCGCRRGAGCVDGSARRRPRRRRRRARWDCGARSGHLSERSN